VLFAPQHGIVPLRKGGVTAERISRDRFLLYCEYILYLKFVVLLDFYVVFLTFFAIFASIKENSINQNRMPIREENFFIQ